jgi:hypothetical protein
MPAPDFDKASSSTSLSLERAAIAAGAALAGWALGRGRALGFVAGLAAAAGARLLTQSKRRELPRPLPTQRPLPMQTTDNLHQLSPGDFLPGVPDTSNEAQWQKLAMSLLEVVHAMATRPTPTTGPEPAPSAAPLKQDYAIGPLVWEQRDTTQSHSDSWGDTVWFGMQDMLPAREMALENAQSAVEMPASPSEAVVCEVILPPERPPERQPQDSEVSTVPQVVVVADFVPEADRAREALMQALQADEVAELDYPFPIVAPEPVLPMEPLPELGGRAEETELERPATVGDVEHLLQPDPSAVAMTWEEDELTTVPKGSLLYNIIAKPGLEIGLPEPRPMGVSPMAFAPHIIPADPNGAIKPIDPAYASSRLVPVAPNKEKAPARKWPRALLALAMLLAGLLVTLHWMTDGAVPDLRPIMEWWHGDQPKPQEQDKQILPRTVSLKPADARA